VSASLLLDCVTVRAPSKEKKTPNKAKRRILARPPLGEAILEVRWGLQPMAGAPGSEGFPGIDPGYPLSVGRLYDRIRTRFPEMEKLPASAAPDEFTPYMVKYRFRRERGGWPCVQLGPGVATVNFTKDDYTWNAFRATVLQFLPDLSAAYASSRGDLTATSVMLRYVNAVLFDAKRDDVMRFVSDKLHLTWSLPAEIASDPRRAHSFWEGATQINIPLAKPAGVALLQVGTGIHNSAPAVIWDLRLTSSGADVPPLGADFRSWLEKAHEVIEDWFFALIRGELEESFGGRSA
jgi:uncharacterized protein (TIGR04255 family)